MRTNTEIESVCRERAENALRTNGKLHRGMRLLCAKINVFNSSAVVCHKAQTDSTGVVSAIDSDVLAGVQLRNVASLDLAGALVHRKCQNGLSRERLHGSRLCSPSVQKRHFLCKNFCGREGRLSPSAACGLRLQGYGGTSTA